MVVEVLPKSFLYILPEYNDPKGRPAPAGMLKYFGGRFVRPEDLHLVPATRVVNFLWADGRVLAWINLNVEAVQAGATVFRMFSSKNLYVAKRAKMFRDIPICVDPEDPVEPFRMRGSMIPLGWRSVEKDGRFSLQVS